MKSYYIYIIASFLLLQISSLNLRGQGNRQEWCTTSTTVNPLARVDMNKYSRNTSEISIRIFVHIVNETNGTGGVSRQDVLDELRLVQFTLDPKICLYLVGIDEINDSYYTSGWTDKKGEELGEVNAHFEAIDAYILPSYTTNGGKAYSIPNLFFTMGADGFGTHVFAHELGHCLGLLHTHESVFGYEFVDGSNCSTAGDLICDTPADPELGVSNVNFDYCDYTGSKKDPNRDYYRPDPSFIMSYARDVGSGENCTTRFSEEQFIRMYVTINELIPTILVTDDDLILHSQTFSIEDVFATAIGSIWAGASPPILGDYVVENSAFVTHTAGEFIRLDPGFEAKPNEYGLYAASVRNVICNNLSLLSRMASNPEKKPEVSSPKSKVNLSDRVQSSGGLLNNTLLAKAYPNPFTEQITIELELASMQEVSILMLNTMGQTINVVENNNIRYAGTHQLSISTQSLPNGIYYIRIQAGDQQIVEKVIKNR